MPISGHSGCVVRDLLLWACGGIVALAATGLAWAIRWLNRAGLEVVHTDVPDTVPASWVEMHAR
jgi:hypothetical protein